MEYLNCLGGQGFLPGRKILGPYLALIGMLKKLPSKYGPLRISTKPNPDAKDAKFKFKDLVQ